MPCGLVSSEEAQIKCAALGLALEDIRELFDERLVTRGEPIDIVRVTVIADDGRNGREQPDGRCDQRFGVLMRECA